MDTPTTPPDATTQATTELASEVASAEHRRAALAYQPRFIRIPAGNATCPITGLRRGTLSRLVTEQKVRSVSLREDGHSRGVRLIDLDSLLTYLDEHAVGPDR
jgi:hypothetical protein